MHGFLKDAARVARLVDTYLAEAALEARLRPAEFEESSPGQCPPATDVLDSPSVLATAA